MSRLRDAAGDPECPPPEKKLDVVFEIQVSARSECMDTESGRAGYPWYDGCISSSLSVTKATSEASVRSRKVARTDGEQYTA